MNSLYIYIFTGIFISREKAIFPEKAKDEKLIVASVERGGNTVGSFLVSSFCLSVASEFLYNHNLLHMGYFTLLFKLLIYHVLERRAH